MDATNQFAVSRKLINSIFERECIMLPDFLNVKGKLEIMFDYAFMQYLSLHLGPVANVPVSLAFEGNKTILVREDGSVEEMNPKQATAELQVDLTEFEKINEEVVINKIDGVAEEMAGQKAKSFYEEVGKAAEEVGNVVDADGKPFSMDLFFEGLEKIDIDFDEAGNPSGLMCPVHPKLFPSIAKVIEQAKDDPEINKRYDAIMDRKREEWRVRESNRKLVG